MDWNKIYKKYQHFHAECELGEKMKTILQTNQLCKDYINGTQTQQVLKNVDISIGEGEFVSIMGSSGSGKSTLLYAMSGMDKATSGSVKINSQEITTMTEEELARLRLNEMGFVFQQSHLLKNLNIEDNILLPAFKANKIQHELSIQRVHMLMTKMGVVELAKNRIHEASGGQLQRIGICRALINEPKILFGDEPTGALNLSSTLGILDLFKDIHRDGSTIVLVTHDARVAARSERVLFMIDGQIVDELILGRQDETTISNKDREVRLIEWLKENEF
jgi:putative ABC transport system ATP-binding protein